MEQIGFQTPHRIGLLILSVAMLALILELVRRRRFKERYALLWLASSVFGLIVGLFPQLIVWIAQILHVQFLTVFFGFTFVFLLGLVLSFSMVISRMSEQTRDLAQEVALLDRRLMRLEKDKETHD